MSDHSLPAFITQTFKKYLEDGGYAWRLVSEETKDTHWEEFKKQYYSDEGLDDEIYKKWFAKAAKRYSDFVHNAKRRRHTEGRPPYVPEQVWASWCAYWDTDADQELSQKAKKNRLSEPDGEGTGQFKHRGGSRSAAAHAVALVEETGGDVGSTVYATFRRFHFKDGQYTNTKSERIGVEVERRYALACQPLSDGTLPPPVNINQIYLEVYGGLNNKNRIFGIESLYTSHASSPTASNIFSTRTSSQQYQDDLKAQLEAERVEMEARMEARIEARLKVVEDKYLQNNDDLRAQIDALKEFMTRGPGPS